MKIKMTGRKWATSAHKRAMRKLVRHAVSHYPKDHSLHSAVASALDATCSGKAKAGKRVKRKASRRRAPARRRMMRTPMRRRRAMRTTRRRMRRRA